MTIVNISEHVVMIKTTTGKEIELLPQDSVEVRGIINLDDIRSKVMVISGSDDEFVS